jgi:phospholipid-binding lipoprotein MlaA
MRIPNILVAFAALILTGCTTTHPANPADPLESFNRGVYRFNDTLDVALIKPVARGYNKVMPNTGKSLVNNFFSNLDDVVVTANDLLQFKFVQAFSDGMRVLVNSTIGVGGLVDVAAMNLDKHNEDFGQTLGYWGLKSGPYLVLPVLGPSTLRDGIGDMGDTAFSPIAKIRKIRTRNQLYITKAVNRRAQLLDEENVMDGAIIDRYSFIRDAYLQRRQNLVYDGNPPQDIYDYGTSSENNITPQPVDAPTPVDEH